ncbi:MAG: hypothetical protein M1838_001475 [Thelocarpon superellum]|nr:MAG: hypothetical protein M1838_001475 [Thelocarpon superellum]
MANSSIADLAETIAGGDHATAADHRPAEVSATRKLRILMLHGFTQSGPRFHDKTRALEKAISKALPAAPAPNHLPAYPGGVELVYPTGPFRLEPGSLPGQPTDATAPHPGSANEDHDGRAAVESWAWWRKDEQTGEYEGIEQGWGVMAETLKQRGPFAGVIGFSQGAAAAAMLAALLEPRRRAALERGSHALPTPGIPYPPQLLTDDGSMAGARAAEPSIIHPPFRFAVSYSGFRAPHARYAALYDPPIATPLLHFIGSLDSVVDESRSLHLVEACSLTDDLRSRRVILHPGGHFLPTQKQFVNVLVAFIRESVGHDVADPAADTALTPRSKLS